MPLLADQIFRQVAAVLERPENPQTSAPPPEGWERLLARLAPWCYLRLSGDHPEHLLPLRSAFYPSYRTTLALNLLLHREMKRILLAFAEQAIPAIPLKGTFLALRLYGDLGARPTSDHDVFLRAEDFPKAAPLLESLGYKSLSPASAPTGYDRAFQRVSSPTRQEYLEIHLGLGDLPAGARRFPSEIWERARPELVEGTPCRLMDPTDELLYLCLHLAKHRFADPLYALDLHLAATQWERAIDWTDLAERARRHRLGSAAALAFLTAQRRFATPVPDALLPALGLPGWKRRYFEAVEWKDFAHPESPPLPDHGPLYTLFLLILDDSWADRLARLKKALSPSPETLQAGGFGAGWAGRVRRLLSKFGSLAVGLSRCLSARLRAAR